MKRAYTMTTQWRKNQAIRKLKSSARARADAVEAYEFYCAGLYAGFPMQPTTAALVRMMASLDLYDAHRRQRPESAHRAKLRRRRHQFDERPHLHFDFGATAAECAQPLVGRSMASAVADQLLPQPDWHDTYTYVRRPNEPA